jgi:hypothetical protein
VQHQEEFVPCFLPHQIDATQHFLLPSGIRVQEDGVMFTARRLDEQVGRLRNWLA